MKPPRDIKCAQWHPHKALIASCSKDSTVRLWDPRSHECVNTLYGHKSQVFKVRAWLPSFRVVSFFLSVGWSGVFDGGGGGRGTKKWSVSWFVFCMFA